MYNMSQWSAMLIFLETRRTTSTGMYLVAWMLEMWVLKQKESEELTFYGIAC